MVYNALMANSEYKGLGQQVEYRLVMKCQIKIDINENPKWSMQQQGAGNTGGSKMIFFIVIIVAVLLTCLAGYFIFKK